MKRLMFLFLSFLFLLNSCMKPETPVNSFSIILQGIDLDKISKLPQQLIIIDYSFDGSATGELKKENVTLLKKSGKKVFAYLSIGEAETYRFYWKEEFNNKQPSWIFYENPNWPGNYKVIFWNSEWQNIIFSYLRRIMDKGFDGVFLDTIDTYKTYMENNPQYNFKKSMINFIKKIIEIASNEKDKDFKIIFNNAEELAFDDSFIMNNITGFVAESLYTDGSENYLKESDINLREKNLIKLRKNGKYVMVIEYLKNKAKQKELKDRAANRGFLIRFLDSSLSMDSSYDS
jgi:cysteinyl-tRNA synthetase, unknown class